MPDKPRTIICDNCELAEVERYTDDDVGLCAKCYCVLFGGFWHEISLLEDWVIPAFKGEFGVIGKIPFTNIEIVLFKNRVRNAG